MFLSFLNLALLAGLAGLAIPPIIHFFHRRRHDVVDWGAMQFLEFSTARRRKFFLEEVLLLLARMALVALLVFFLAQPMMEGWLADRLHRPSRDVVFVLDTSASMTTNGAEGSPWRRAHDALAKDLERRGANDRVGLVVAGLPAAIAVPLTHAPGDLDPVLRELPTPRGAADGPAAIELAWHHLREFGRHAEREIVVVTDRQTLGWFDAEAMAKWRSVGDRMQSTEKQPVPQMRWISVQPPEQPGTNYSLERITPSRRLAGVGQKTSFSAVVVRHGDAPSTTMNIVFEIDGTPIGRTKLEVKQARTDVRFDHRFERSGAFLVTMRFADANDVLAADDRQDVVFEVLPELPILLVDAEDPGSPSSTTFYLRKAFAEPGDKTRTSLVSAKVVRAANLSRDTILPKEGAAPRVVILSDVAKWEPDQIRDLERFVHQGGGLLHLIGPRAGAAKNGSLAASFEAGIRVNGSAVIDPKATPLRLDPATFLHPALKLFADPSRPSLGVMPHRQWAKLEADSGMIVARFANGDPWLVASKHGQGQLLVSSLPMDGSWDAVLAKSWEFPVLIHELVFALADVRSDAFNLLPGQPILLHEHQEKGIGIQHAPSGAKPWQPDAAGVYPPPGPAGAYRLEIGKTAYPIVVHSDPRESVLSYAADDDVKRVEESVPARWSGRSEAAESLLAHDAWLTFLLAFIACLVLESWMARGLARQRAGA
ncbi:MAG: BatA and WFA domain-containing protein [Gemmataceae bacterium]|nr:BatA and WFA domain-containing protein [Gemmataceae bacterium]